MEHFFLDDRFYSDLDDFIEDYFEDPYTELYPKEAIEALEEDWSIRVQELKLEPMFEVERDEINSLILDYLIEKHEDRFPQDSDEEEKDLSMALKASFDVTLFNSLVPKLYYPTTFTTITKQNLLDFLND